MHSLARHVLIPLHPFGIDLSITNKVLLLWAAALITFFLLLLSCRRKNIVAKGILQNLFEGLIELVEKTIARENIGKEARSWAPFLLTLFFFILFCNLLGLVPVPSHVETVTANFSVPVGLAIIVFLLTIGISLRKHGAGGFLKKFVPSGVPGWTLPLIVPIEIVSWLAKPVSLAIRLFANMLVGHALILIFLTMLTGLTGLWILAAPLPLAGAVIMSCFEIFVSFIQAFVFTMLAGMYISEALAEPHLGENG